MVPSQVAVNSTDWNWPDRLFVGRVDDRPVTILVTGLDSRDTMEPICKRRAVADGPLTDVRNRATAYSLSSIATDPARLVYALTGQNILRQSPSDTWRN